jgi:hypothetical protein
MSDSLEVTGVIKKVGDVLTISESFSKREIWIENGGEYPNTINLELHKDKCSLADNLKEGDEVKLLFNLRGRVWDDPKGGQRCFNTLAVWKVEELNKTAQSAPQSNAPAYTAPSSEQIPF